MTCIGAGDAPRLGHVGLQFLGVRRVDRETAGPRRVGDVGDGLAGDRRPCPAHVDAGDVGAARVGDHVGGRPHAAEQRHVHRVAGDLRFDLRQAVRAGQRHGHVDGAVHVGGDLGNRESPAWRRLRAAPATSLTLRVRRSGHGRQQRRLPRLMRPAMRPSMVDAGQPVVVIEPVVVADDRGADGAGHRHVRPAWCGRSRGW